jgi:hypothetical protein
MGSSSRRLLNQSTHYNLVRLHKTLRVTPAMAANVTDRVFSAFFRPTSVVALAWPREATASQHFAVQRVIEFHQPISFPHGRSVRAGQLPFSDPRAARAVIGRAKLAQRGGGSQPAP